VPTSETSVIASLSSSGVNIGLIVGLVVLFVVLIILGIVGLVFFLRWRRKRNDIAFVTSAHSVEMKEANENRSKRAGTNPFASNQ
jgi:hypothetical protein